MDEKLSLPASNNQDLPSTPNSVQGKMQLWPIILGGVIIVAIIIIGAVFLLRQEPAQTSHIRDVFIIFIALETLVIGVALVILMVQLATLINLLQNEIKPILDSTNETANTLRGTATFISNNLAEPVIRINQYLAAFQKLFELIRIGNKK